ncbi:dATP pyrophosphohydrolase [Phenylobacterium sp. LjRoot225]|uniref:dATP pyrophosphohydrolase n=1 Tax=Phenylobacterium sp. LjRoot225 TaxID=3342285 RepID=UPI003ECD8FCC
MHGRIQDTGELRIAPVASAAELDRFVRLPMRLNAADPNYIAPLMMERREALTPKTNPFFAHAEVQLWLAVRDGRDVGRISAQIDHLAPSDGGPRAGHFGLIAAEDDPTVFAALFATAEAWLTSRGCVRALGPFNLSINEEVGLLVDGFDTPPMVMMGHDPPYVAAHVEALGYRQIKDVHAYASRLSDDLPPMVRKMVDRGPPAGVRLRMLDMKRYDEEVRLLTDILNDAWSHNWGFTPTTEAETAQLAKSLKMVVDPRLAWYAEIDGEVAGFIVILPNVNEAIRDLKGKLLPFGWAKLLWRLKVQRLKTARVPLMGVRRKFSRMRRGQLLPFLLIDAARAQARALGYQTVELSWILDDNLPMRSILEAAGSSIYKTYRIYEKTLG